MNLPALSRKRVRTLLSNIRGTRIIVMGDVMLDQFIWGTVGRISPEAPVPVVEFERESFMPGGAANVARNLTALGVQTDLMGVVGQDEPARQVRALLETHGIRCAGVLQSSDRCTSVKTRIVAHSQQVVRIDRESRAPLNGEATARLLSAVEPMLADTSAIILEDYGKGVITQRLLDELKSRCRARGIWLSLDPKPVHHLTLSDLSLLTPNRKEAFELAGIHDETRHADPLLDPNLMRVADKLLQELRPALLLITIGELGMLLCQRNQKPIHIPTVAQDVFDVSGAGDTVIAFFTLAVAAGASPLEAAILSNHAAGIVVGKIGTATVSHEELLSSFKD